MRTKKHPIIHIIVAAVMAAAVCPVFGWEAVHAAPKTNPDPPESAWDLMPEMNPGWNLGNSLEWQNIGDPKNLTENSGFGYIESGKNGKPGFEFVETKLKNPVTTRELIDAVAARGFRSIRIPVSFYHHLKESQPRSSEGPRPGTTVDEEWLKRVQQVVDWSLDAGLYVVINDHHDTGMYMNHSWIRADYETRDEQIAKFTNIWRQYAYYFRDYDNRLIFQSLGEVVNPERSFSSGHYRDFQMSHDLNQAFIETVRESGSNNKNRFLILPTYASNADPIFVDQNFYEPYRDSVSNRLIFSVHNYSTDLSVLEWSFDMLYKKATRYGAPFVFTECGAKVGLSNAKRSEVAAKLVEQAEKYGMAIMIWDDGDHNEGGLGLVDRYATIADKQLRYAEGGEDVINAMFRAKADTKKLGVQELQDAGKEEFASEAFVPLDADHMDHLRAGMYSTIDANAHAPMSIYMPQPATQAAIFPYVKTNSFDQMQFTLPDKVNVTIRELDKNGRFLRDRYVTASRTYKPDSSVDMLAINVREAPDESSNKVKSNPLTFDDYRSFVSGGTLKITATDPRPLADSVTVTSLAERTPGEVVIQWERDNEASGYRIMRREEGSSQWTKLLDMDRQNAENEGNTYVDTTAEPETSYRYTVRAYRETGREISEGADIKLLKNWNKDGLPITTQETQELQPVTKLPQSVGKTTIRNTIANTVSTPKYNDVIYDKVTGATGYDITYRHISSDRWVTKSVGNTTRGRMSGLSLGGSYQVKVRARKAETPTHKAATGEYSPVVYRYFYTVKKIRLRSSSKGSFTMSWAKDPGAAGYQILFSTNRNGAGAARNINNVGSKMNSFTKKGLKSGKTYYVQIRCYKKIGTKNYIGNISRPVAVKVR